MRDGCSVQSCPPRSYLLLEHLNHTHLSERTNKIRSPEGAVIRHYLPDLGIQLIKLTSSAAPPWLPIAASSHVPRPHSC